jgi:hypothetical protein
LIPLFIPRADEYTGLITYLLVIKISKYNNLTGMIGISWR